MFQIGENKFYNQKNEILMKIPELKRSGIQIIVEYRGIPTGFPNQVRVNPHKKVHIDIDPNAKLLHSRPYPVPQIHLKTFKMELNHLVRIGVLASQQESEWASP
jgi:hypothetical protein